jgi:hypothetical protein
MHIATSDLDLKAKVRVLSYAATIESVHFCLERSLIAASLASPDTNIIGEGFGEDSAK